MTDVVIVLTDLYDGADRMTRDEISRRASAISARADVIAALETLPDGEYTLDEVLDVIDVEFLVEPIGLGIEPAALTDEDLMRELAQVHNRRNETFRHGSDDALEQLNRRTVQLEGEYLRRFPSREVDERRLRSGARRRNGG
jgi:hypothetical protein